MKNVFELLSRFFGMKIKLEDCTRVDKIAKNKQITLKYVVRKMKKTNTVIERIRIKKIGRNHLF